MLVRTLRMRHRRRASTFRWHIQPTRLFRPEDIRNASEHFAALGYRTSYIEFTTRHGHDAFLAESAALADVLYTRVLDRGRLKASEPVRAVEWR